MTTAARTLVALAALAAVLVAPAALGAQRGTRRPTTQPTRPTPTTRPTQPAARRDTAGRAPGDTTPVRDTTQLVEWAEEDSVMRALRSRQGYSVTQYQGNRITFEARDRTLLLEGKPSAVRRGESILVGDTILYNDSLDVVQVRSDTAILRDPGYQAADVVARGYLEYDLVRRVGTVRDIATATETGGQKWYLHGTGGAQFVNDTSAARRNAFYVRNGNITSCEESEPHYHFAAQEIKVVSKNVLVARPAVLYIGNVPVFWLPFIFQDLRSGRRSGLIMPRFGFAELVRNGPTYRRTIDNFGYYWAISDFMDANVTVDWRSGARGRQGDPGYLRYNGDWQYKWIDRFLNGRLSATYDSWRDGQTTTSLSWNHQQAFSQRTSLNVNGNYSSNSQQVARNTINAWQAQATIRSDANFQTGFGPLNVAIGGNRTQYTSRPQVDLGFPNLNLTTTGPLSLGEWLTWTPTFSLSNSLSSNQEAVGLPLLRPNGTGGIDTVTRYTSNRNSSLTFGSPLRIWEFDINPGFSVRETETKGPQQVLVYGEDSLPETRFFTQRYQTEIQYTPSLNLPRILQGKWNVTPTVSLSPVQGGPFAVRSNFSGGEWVFQRFRPSFGASATPTVYGLFPGFGPIARFRHAINPQIAWSYSPDASNLFSREFARALNQSQQVDLRVLTQNTVSLGLSQTIEAKLKSGADTSLDGGRKIKLLALNFSSIAYDFVRADTIGRGLTTETFNYDVRSDLLPGFDFRAGYSLFQGVASSDTAEFKPFRTSLAANLSLNANSALVVAIGRLFGRRDVSARDIETDQQGTGEQGLAQQAVAAQRIAGSGSRNMQLGVPNAGQGWNLSLSFSETRSRPISGLNVQYLDPRVTCQAFNQQPFVYQACLDNPGQYAGGNATPDTTLSGSTRYVSPPQRTVNAQTSFNITPKWAAQWSTSYDLERKEFGLHQVSLQRELHDWRAVFAFTQSPLGAFAFNFFISLNAQPDIKFDYNRNSYPTRQR